MSISFGDFFTTTIIKAKYMPEIFFSGAWHGGGLCYRAVPSTPSPVYIVKKNKTLISFLVYFDPGAWVRGLPSIVCLSRLLS
jgi:hypothetical protein